MTDKTKYSNISVSNETYRELQRLSRDLLPGKTPLSISKTVTVLVNCKIQNLENSLEEKGYQTDLNKIPLQTLIKHEHTTNNKKRS